MRPVLIPACTMCCSSWFNLSFLLHIISTCQLPALSSRQFAKLYSNIAILTFIVPRHQYHHEFIHHHCQRPSQLSTLSRIFRFTLIITPKNQHPLGFLRPSSSTSPGLESTCSRIPLFACITARLGYVLSKLPLQTLVI